MNKLKVTINAEADIRFALSKEEQLEKDAANKAKIAFLIGKSDEKTQALTILMLHFCAGLQHIQDLEDQEVMNNYNILFLITFSLTIILFVRKLWYLLKYICPP